MSTVKKNVMTAESLDKEIFGEMGNYFYKQSMQRGKTLSFILDELGSSVTFQCLIERAFSELSDLRAEKRAMLEQQQKEVV